MTGSQCKQFCITHFKEMCTQKIGRIFMKTLARYCTECVVWYWRKLWLSIYCPCCHKKLREKLSNLGKKLKYKRKPLTPTQLEHQRLYNREYRKKHREQKNAYQRAWYRQRLYKLNNEM